MVIDDFVDPLSKITLSKDDKGNLYYRKGKQHIVYKNHNGSYDFVLNENLRRERDYYDIEYKRRLSKPLTLQECCEKWQHNAMPENFALLRSLGDLSGKKILLIGNGTSFKELYFLYLRAQLVYTDLSIVAIKFMKELFYSSELGEMGYNNVEFHAVDALHLPFPDASFDIIYGYAFVHHIDDIDSFFSEISRCLKKGGMCRFLDNAYSPLWHFMKNTCLKPLQLYSHRRTGISPEDLKATKKGGYRKDEIIQIMQKYNFRELVFERVSFFQHLWTRGIIKLFGGNVFFIRKGTPIMTGIDKYLTQKSSFMKKNTIRLVWGFYK